MPVRGGGRMSCIDERILGLLQICVIRMPGLAWERNPHSPKSRPARDESAVI